MPMMEGVPKRPIPDHRKHTGESERMTLSWKAYIVLLIISQIGSFSDVCEFLSMTTKFGGVVYTTAYLIAYFVLGLPAISLSLFMGHFSKSGYMRVWSMAPLFRGAAITTLIYSIMTVISNCVLGGYAIFYVLTMFHPIWLWHTCEFAGSTKDCVGYSDEREFSYESDCIPFIITFQRSDEEWDSLLQNNLIMNRSYVMLSSLQYFRHHMLHLTLNERKPPFGPVNPLLILSTTFLWLVVISLAIMGINATKNVVCRTSVLALIIMYGLFFGTIYAKVPLGPTTMDGASIQYLKNKRSRTWYAIVAHVLARSYPTVTINIGSYGPENMLPHISAIFNAVIYGTFLYILTIWSTIAYSAIRYNYTTKDIHCIAYQGVEIIFALIPDLILNHFPTPMMFGFLYYLALLLIIMNGLIVESTALLDALVDLRVTYQGLRWQFGLGIFFIVAVGNLLLLNPATMLIREAWFLYADRVCVSTVMALYFICILWIYGIRRVRNDIAFMYDNKVSMGILLIAWNFLPLVTLVYIITFFPYLSLFFAQIPNWMAMREICFVLNILVLIPIPLGLVTYYFGNMDKAHKNGVLWIFRNAKDWGPRDLELKRQRLRFNPRKEIRYKSTKNKCYHSCLLNSKRLRREIERLDANRKMYIETKQNDE